MATEVRIARDEEDVAAGRRVVGTAFLERPDDETVDFWRQRVQLDRQLVALDGGVVCGTARSFATPITLPGGATVGMGAVSSVGVLPTHRRRGHLTRLMELQLSDLAERGEPVAGLVSAEWPIYGRYGYGMAIEAATYEVDRRTTRFLDDRWHGTVELVDLAALRKLAPPVFDAHRAATVGAIERADLWWDVTYGVTPAPGWEDKGNRFRALHRDAAGDVDGFLTYSVEGTWERNVPSGRVHVGDLVTLTAGAYADLWRYLLEIDWTASVKASPRPVDEVLPHLLVDGRAVTQTHRGDHIWLRPLDLPALLSARRYRCEGSVVLEVVDPFLGRGGRFRVDGGPEGGSCRPTTEAADLTLPVAAAGAGCVVGGVPLTLLHRAGMVDEERSGAVARADALFGWSPPPWCSTGF